MSTADKQIRAVLLVITIVGLVAFGTVHLRNYLVQKTYQGQAKDIKDELRSYKALNDINYELWSGDNDLKKTATLRSKVKKISPDSKELRASKQYLLKALDYIYKAQEQSGLSVSQINLEGDNPQLALPREYLDKATQEAALSTQYLKEFEQSHQQLFQ